MSITNKSEVVEWPGLIGLLRRADISWKGDVDMHGKRTFR